MEIGPFRLGMRTIKSALSVMLCIIFFRVTDRGLPMIAALSAVFSLRQDFSTSVSFGKSRVVGNVIGGGLAILYFYAQQFFQHEFIVELLFLPFLIILVIVLSDAINNNTGIIAAVSTLLLISLSIPQGKSIHYAVDRVVDTFIGTFIGIALNIFMKPKLTEETREISEELADLEKKERELARLKKQVQQRLEQEKKHHSK